MNNKGSGLTPAQALDKLDALYEQSVVALRNVDWPPESPDNQYHLFK
ncbi:hypothetical protein J0X55_004493 [Shigella flexneri]|uniref:AMP nucleosidase n=1 Tax=Shigella flexneri TaxID=623 RepID=A0A658Z2H3_SHIFL|nr:hypothetical protein [Shigella flexneri]EHK3301376.1 hypothetical protein [Shigella flexneri]MCW3760911.1 hypothetical protein [Shigella flexneri]MDO8228221.1 hypothetical protein [Shigella flexneri]MDO8238750.1 hypothetical protein [Shigella flexneri]QQM50708.1 hypothetical protein JGY96_08635 [Shigella flexneri 3a]